MKKYFKSIAILIVSVLLLTFSDALMPAESDNIEITDVEIMYNFRTEEQYESHYQKHKDEFGDISKENYLLQANALIQSDADDVLTKLEADDNDYLYYRESTNEFLVLSPDGYIRTYFRPDDGIDYYNRK